MIRYDQSVPIISVLLPAYNAEKYLREAVDSILCQSFANFELIVINDGSTDGTEEILAEYSLRDARIVFISRENRGLVSTLNEGLNVARGIWVARMDADDISHPERFAKQIELMERDGADICGCHWFVINEAGKKIDARIMPISRDAFTIFLADTVPFAHGSVLIRKSFLLSHSLTYEAKRYCEDYDLWIRMHEYGAKFVNVNEFLFSYRESSVSLSKRKLKEMANDKKMLNLRFVQRNATSCINAVINLSNDYASLSLMERINLLKASYRVSVKQKNLIIINTIKRSNLRAIFIAFLEILR